MKRLVLACVLALLVTGVARAEDSDRNFAFPSEHGILGMRELIDARCTEALNIRAQIRGEISSENLDSNYANYFKDFYGAHLVGGASALGMIDAGARWVTVEELVQRYHQKGSFFRPHPDYENGTGDLELAGKVAFKLAWLSLGAYGIGHFNSGAIRLEHTNQIKLGACASLGLLENRIGVHGNLVFVDLNAGKLAFGYRAGVDVVPFASDLVLVRLFGYLDGLEYGGTAGSDVRLALGVQTLVMKIVTLEVSNEYKLIDGDLLNRIHDTGTFGVTVAAGASITF